VTSCCRALVGFLVLSAVALNLGCRKSAPSPEAGGEKPTVPALAGLEKLAIAPSVPVSQVIGAEGGTLTSPDGGKLVVPPGVFRDPTKLQVSTVNLNLPAMAFDVKEARAFVMSTAGETGKLSQPVVLEISKPSAAVTVMELSDGSWQVRKVPAGATTRIEITHFSDPTYGVVEWFSATNLQLNQALAEADNSKDPIKYQRTKIEKGTGDVKAFYGVGESGGRSVHDNCAEIQAMLSATASPGQFQVPDNPGPGVSTLALFLHSADVPKAFGGVWYDMVKGSQDQIASALTSQSAELTPAQFLKICIDANGGNIYLGVLAAHNYLKDITYRGRDSYDGGHGMPADAAAARHLRSWRPNSNISEGGYYDKMGPIYHLFAAMTAELWGTHLLGAVAVNGESFLRSARIGADKPDLDKAQADSCGEQIGSWISQQSTSENWTGTWTDGSTTVELTGTGDHVEGTDRWVGAPGQGDTSTWKDFKRTATGTLLGSRECHYFDGDKNVTLKQSVEISLHGDELVAKFINLETGTVTHWTDKVTTYPMYPWAQKDTATTVHFERK